MIGYTQSFSRPQGHQMMCPIGLKYWICQLNFIIFEKCSVNFLFLRSNSSKHKNTAGPRVVAIKVTHGIDYSLDYTKPQCPLTHCDLETPFGIDSEIGHQGKGSVVACSAQSPYLDQCWLFLSYIHCNTVRCSFNQNTTIQFLSGNWILKGLL